MRPSPRPTFLYVLLALAFFCGAGAARAQDVPARPDLHVIAVGINDYRGGVAPGVQAFNLRFAVADAVSVADTLARVGTGFYGAVYTHLLTDSEATLGGLDSTFAAVTRAAGPDDTVVFFFAGNGANHGPGGAFRLQVYGDTFERARAGTEGLTSAQLRLWLARLPARRQLVLIDGCSTPSGFNELLTGLAPTDPALQGLVAKSLTVIGPVNVTAESDGHGHFTRELLRVLANGGGRGDGLLTAWELAASLPRVLPGTASVAPTPLTAYSIGDDIPLGTPLNPEGVSRQLHALQLVGALTDALGPDDPATVAALASLGGALVDVGQVGIAREPLRQALRLRETALGAGHPLTLRVRANLAMTDTSTAGPSRELLAVAAGFLRHGETSLARQALEYPARESCRAVEDRQARQDCESVFIDQQMGQPGTEGRGPSAPDERGTLRPRRGIEVEWRWPVFPEPDTPPRIVLRGDDADTLVATDSVFVLSGLVADERGAFEVEVSGQAAALTPDGRFWHEVHLGPGATPVRVRATDTGGHVVERHLTVLRAGLRGIETATAADTTGAGLLVRTGRDRALLFATDRYTDPAIAGLVNPVADAEAIAAELERLGFTVEVVRNPTRSDIYAAVRRYVDPRQSPPRDDGQLLVFFAGHGTYDEVLGEGYVIPADGRAGAVETYVDYSSLARMLDAGRDVNRRVLLVLDVCFGGTFLQESRTGGGVYRTASVAETVERYARVTPGRVAITSGSREYVSDGVPGRHSPFAHRVLEALRSGGGEDADGLLTYEELLGYVRRASGPTPLAGTFGSGEPGGSFFFVVP